MSLMIIRPSIKLGVTMGIVVGLTQLTKASVLPGLAIFLAIFLMKESVHLYRRLNPKLAENESLVGAFRKRFISVLVAVVTFLIVMFPYIRESKLIYGQYFYNANQNFYPWYDSWEQAKADPLYKVIRDQAPDFSSFELPSLRKYLREHTPLQIFERIRDGVQHQYFLSLRQGILFNYSYLLLFSLGFLAVFNWQGTSELLREHKYLILFMVSFLSGYFLLFSWYTVISEEPRFLLSLQIVFLFSMFVGIRVFSQRFPRMTVFREAIDTKNLINFVYTNLTLMIMVDTYFTLTVGLLIRR